MWSVCFNPNGNLLASGGDNHTVRLWDPNTAECLHVLKGHTDLITSICFSPNNKLLASGSDYHTVQLWDPDTGECLQVMQGHTGWVWCVCFSPDGTVLACGNGDQMIRQWDTQSGTCIRVLQGYTNVVRSVCFSPMGKFSPVAVSTRRSGSEITHGCLSTHPAQRSAIRPHEHHRCHRHDACSAYCTETVGGSRRDRPEECGSFVQLAKVRPSFLAH